MRVKSNPTRALDSFYLSPYEYVDVGINTTIPVYDESCEFVQQPVNVEEPSFVMMTDNYDSSVNAVNNTSDGFSPDDELKFQSTDWVVSEDNAEVSPSQDGISVKREDDDWQAAYKFVEASIQLLGEESNMVPSQKTIQKLGIHPSRQRRARDFLRNAGIITINFRTKLTERCSTLGDVEKALMEMLEDNPSMEY
jgi:hypothetical protein